MTNIKCYICLKIQNHEMTSSHVGMDATFVIKILTVMLVWIITKPLPIWKMILLISNPKHKLLSLVTWMLAQEVSNLMHNNVSCHMSQGCKKIYKCITALLEMKKT